MTISYPRRRHSLWNPSIIMVKKGVSSVIRPLVRYMTKWIFLCWTTGRYPISLAVLKISSAVLGFTPFFLFRAVDMVAAEKPVASLIRLIVVFIYSSPFVFCLSNRINIIINILNDFAIFFTRFHVSLYVLDDLIGCFLCNMTIF